MKTFLAIVGGLVIVGVLGLLVFDFFAQKQVIVINELFAQQTMRYVNTAMIQYYSINDRYASTFSELGSLISPDLATGQKHGYRFTLRGSRKSYSITAVPVEPGSTGDRTFYSNETGVLRWSRGAEPATGESPPLDR